MDKLKSFFTRIKPQKDCDLTDRVTYYYTVLLLTIFAFIIFGWSLFGTPIQCWFPAQYKGWWAEYALDYCYVQNTYFVKFSTGKPQNHWELDHQRVELPVDPEERAETTIGYYQWVPFVLALMAISFYVPVAFWRAMYGHSGLSVKTLCDQVGSSQNMSPEDRKSAAKKMAIYLDHSKNICEKFKGSFLAGRYVTVLYLTTKLMSVIICIGQFFMLEHFLGLDSSYWGVKILNDIVRGVEWTETGNFPRVTQCDFKVRELGNLQPHTVQCVLLINMLNEKFFVFLWFWFIMAAVLSALSFVYWLVYALFQASGRRYIISFLLLVDPYHVTKRRYEKKLRKFLDSRLKADGIFLLRLIGHNCGDLVVADLVQCMWQKFKDDHANDFDYPQPEPLTGGKNPVKLATDYSNQDTVPKYLPPLPAYSDLKHKNQTTPM